MSADIVAGFRRRAAAAELENYRRLSARHGQAIETLERQEDDEWESIRGSIRCDEESGHTSDVYTYVHPRGADVAWASNEPKFVDAMLAKSRTK